MEFYYNGSADAVYAAEASATVHAACCGGPTPPADGLISAVRYEDRRARREQYRVSCYNNRNSMSTTAWPSAFVLRCPDVRRSDGRPDVLCWSGTTISNELYIGQTGAVEWKNARLNHACRLTRFLPMHGSLFGSSFFGK